jgi:hypothetical protein
MMDKETFLQNSINDIQGTIRAIDTKLFGLLFLFIAPFTQSENIGCSFYYLYNSNECIMWLILTLAGVFWLLGFFSSFAGIAAISNPEKQVNKGNSDEHEVNGVYYNAGHYKFNIIDSLFSRDKKASLTLKDHHDNFAKQDNYSKELAFEQFKLTYIRDIKLKRQKTALFSGVILFLLISFVIVFKTLKTL